MRVGILGSTELNFKAEDMYRYAKNIAYPREITAIVTTEDVGVAATARDIAESRGLGLMTYSYYRDVVDDCDLVIVFRTDLERPTYGKYAGYKGRPFQEYVVHIDKNVNCE